MAHNFTSQWVFIIAIVWNEKDCETQQKLHTLSKNVASLKTTRIWDTSERQEELRRTLRKADVTFKQYLQLPKVFKRVNYG